MVFDVMVVFPDVLSCFLLNGLAYLWVLYSLFVVAIFTISHRFVIRARVYDDNVDFSGLLIALVTIDELCWIISMMVSLMVSMLSSSCSVSNWFLNSSYNSIL